MLRRAQGSAVVQAPRASRPVPPCLPHRALLALAPPPAAASGSAAPPTEPPPGMCSTPTLLALSRLQAGWVPKVCGMPHVAATAAGERQLPVDHRWWCIRGGKSEQTHGRPIGHS